MSYAENLLLFAGLAFSVIALPGLDMACVMSSSLMAGRKHGLAAVAGVVTGGICHVTMATLGIGVLLKVVPGAFNALLVAGAIYIAWIGISLLHSQTPFGVNKMPATGSQREAFRRGALTSLLNPKAYLFMLAVFPQFLRTEYGPLWMQAMMLWFIIAIAQISIYSAVAIAAAKTRELFMRRPLAGVIAQRVTGTTLVLAAVFTGIEGWRSL